MYFTFSPLTVNVYFRYDNIRFICCINVNYKNLFLIRVYCININFCSINITIRIYILEFICIQIHYSNVSLLIINGNLPVILITSIVGCRIIAIASDFCC